MQAIRGPQQRQQRWLVGLCERVSSFVSIVSLAHRFTSTRSLPRRPACVLSRSIERTWGREETRDRAREKWIGWAMRKTKSRNEMREHREWNRKRRVGFIYTYRLWLSIFLSLCFTLPTCPSHNAKVLSLKCDGNIRSACITIFPCPPHHQKPAQTPFALSSSRLSFPPLTSLLHPPFAMFNSASWMDINGPVCMFYG